VTSSPSISIRSNQTIDLNETRITAGLYARVPETVVLLLVIGSALSLAMVGYSAGLTKRRALLNAIVLVVALGAVITIVVDLDRHGGLHPSQPAAADRPPTADRTALELIRRSREPQAVG